MFFLNYTLLLVFVACAVLVTGSLWGYRSVRGRRAWVRILVRCLAVGVVTCCAVSGGLAIVSSVKTINSAPIYSPDGKKALRLEYSDGGALGGVTFVELYWGYGFRSTVIFSQDGRTVRDEGVQWVTDGEVVIRFHSYGGSDGPWVCGGGQGEVKVRCVAENGGYGRSVRAEQDAYCSAAVN